MFDSNDIQIGSGSLYLYPIDNTNTWSEYLAGNFVNTAVEDQNYRIGHIKGGATFSYAPTFYTVRDDLSQVEKTALTDEQLTFNSGVITWQMNTLNNLCPTGNYDAANSCFCMGGLTHYSQPDYLARFVSWDNTKVIDFRPQITNGFDLAFLPETETTVGIGYSCSPIPETNGRKLYYYAR